MTEINPILNFLTKEDEIKYWMDVAHQMYQRQEDAERELQEYQEHSQLLEKELETSFEQSDRRNRDLRQANYKLSTDNEELKNRLNEQLKLYVATQFELQDLKLYNDELHDLIRKLEQKNDDLERVNREKTVSEEELESQFNMTLEKLALLETDVDELENLRITVHRLKEENKELREEIQLQHQKQNRNIDKNVDNENEMLISNEVHNEKETKINNVIINGREQHEYNVIPLNVRKYARELDKNIEFSQKMHSASKMSEDRFRFSSSQTIKKKITTLEKELREKGSFSISTNTLQRWKDENKDWSQELELRLRNRNEKLAERSPRPRSDTNKYQEENLRNLTTARLNRHIENRVKKVKEEEKRQQNLLWFLKRRYLQLSWLRKK